VKTRTLEDKSPNFAKNKKESKRARMKRLIKELNQLVVQVGNNSVGGSSIASPSRTSCNSFIPKEH